MLVPTDGPSLDEVLPDRGGVRWPSVGVMDPGRDAVYLESGGGCQHHDVGSLPARLEGLSVVPLDVDRLLACTDEVSGLGQPRRWHGGAAKYPRVPSGALSRKEKVLDL